MYKQYYSKFLKANQGKKHFACHSHHYWPDVTLDAMIEYWEDAARLVDKKWDHILGIKVPSTQKYLSRILNFSHPENICFAPNTHDFLIRMLSAFRTGKIKILTTDSEFYSFSRQSQWLQELKLVEITVVPSFPYEDFTDRFVDEIRKKRYDLIFFSQVFFNSGVAVNDMNKIVSSVKDDRTVVVIDGYHGFMALPTDLSVIQDRAFYIGGSYKYAQGGEGCCFMTIPKNCQFKPALTGWFAGFHEIEKENPSITFATDGYRFAGSTMDYTALYRLHAVLELYAKNDLTIEKTHAFVQKLQQNFLNYLDAFPHPHVGRQNLLMLDPKFHGHFYAFKMASTQVSDLVRRDLLKNNVITDSRGSVLRFGFGVYQDENIEFGLESLVRPDL